MIKVFSLLVLLLPLTLFSQTSLTGMVMDEAGKALPYATVALMKPADSTLVFFGITNDKGAFDIKKVSRGTYLVQVAFIGYQTFYQTLKMPEQAGDFGIVVLRTKPLNLPSAEVVAEHIPIVVKKDTIEYNAGAFKTRPDAVAEDLLKKLPGVEVDRAGNIKAMGEDVQNVMVDGKEFFSSDPKVATKNLPADAINKVQVYDKKSEASELAGIEDNSREKTINFLLKDGRKQAWLGDVQAGAGTDSHYTASAKVYRFTAKNQFAMLGMLNNINRFGFSFQDYIDFNGGLPAMMGSGSMKLSITSDSDMPVNFGQTINGLVTSGAGGLNYSFEPEKGNRLYASYLGNGSDRSLKQTISTRNYTSANEYNTLEDNHEDSRNFSHRLNLGWKDKSDSTRTLLFNGNIGLTDASEDAVSLARVYTGGDLINSLEAQANLKRSNLTGNGSFSFMKRGKGAFRLFTAGANAGFAAGMSNNDRRNISRYLGSVDPVTDFQFRDNRSGNHSYGLSGSSLIRIGNGLYLEPEVRANVDFDYLNREQGVPGDGNAAIDSLSPHFGRTSFQLTPGVNLRRNFKKSKIVIGISTAMAETRNVLNGSSPFTQRYTRLLPSFIWESDYKTGHRISLDYNTTVNAPQISMLVPVVENANPLSLFYGNRRLKPETGHDLYTNWLLFDQFSQTSVFARIGGTYTVDRVGYSMTVTDSLVQTIRLMNTKDNYLLGGNVELSTPLRFMGLNFHLALDGRWNKGQTFVNGKENMNTNFSKSVELSFDNRKREKWELSFGGNISITNAKYSIRESLNNRFVNIGYFADLAFTPNASWHFAATADVVNYSSESFTGAVNIPLIGAEISFNFLANKRGMLTFEVYDLLDKNTGIDRISEMNFLRETRSDVIGRYVMLAFKYRINKAAKSNGGLEIDVKRR
jgi:hypothetical protein